MFLPPPQNFPLPQNFPRQIVFPEIFPPVIDSSLTPALKLFDVANFDLTQMIKLKFVPEAVEFCHGRDSAEGICVAVSEAETGKIHMLTPANADGVPKLTVAQKHNAPVHLMRYLFAVHMVLSFDRKGFMEVWDPDTGAWPTGLKGSKNDTTDNLVDNLANRTVTSPTQNRQFLRFASKTDGTDFYELNKLKTHAIACAVAPNNESFALLCADERIRVFRTRSMKKFKELDESVDCLTIAQNDPGQRALHVDHLDFGKRVAGERELRRSSQLQRVSLSFDESGNFLVYPTLVGVKIVNLVTNQLVALLGKVESSERFLQCALYQAKNAPKTRAGATESMGDRGLDGAETGGQTDGSGGRDPTLFVSSFKRPRFYLFTRREPTEDTVDDVGRDVFNEKPTKEDQMLALASDEKRLGRSAILHTTMGDIEFQLFGTECPKTVENML